jgi:hypothetical protein
MLKPELLPGISKAKGYGGSYLLRRKAEDEVEFITIMLWDSIDAIRAVAGHRRPIAAWLVWGLLWEPETLAVPRLAPLPPDEMGRASKAWSRPVQEPDDQPWWFHDEGGLHPSSLISGSSSLLMLGLQGRCLIPVIGRQGTPQMFRGSASSIPQSSGFFGSI